MDLAQAFNAPEVVDFGGRSFPVRQLRLEEWAELQAWLKRAVPSPLTQALRTIQEAESFGIETSEAARKELLDHAQEAAKKWPPAVGTRAWLRAVESADGGPENFVRFVLARSGTGLSPADAADLYRRATAEEVNDLVRAAYFGDPPAPKAADPDGHGYDTVDDGDGGDSGDDWGKLLYQLTGGSGPKGWTYADLGRLTYAQLRNEVYKGGKVKPGPRKISTKGALQLLKDFKAGKWGF